MAVSEIAPPGPAPDRSGRTDDDMVPSAGPSERQQALVLLVLWFLVAVVPLPVREVMPPDESRFAHQAQVMRDTGDWIVPRIGDVPNTDKPPMLFWLANAAALGGARVTEPAARVPSALAALLAVFLTRRLGRRLWRSAALGTIGAALLLTSLSFAKSASWCACDMLLTGFVLAALTCWREALFDERRHSARMVRLVVGWAAVAAGALTKGPLALAWPLGWCLAEALARGRLRSLRHLAHPAGLVVFVLGVAAWLAPFSARVDGAALYDLLFTQSATRYVAAWNGHHPWFFFGVQGPIDLLPWSLFLPVAAWCAWRDLRDPAARARHVALRATLGFAAAALVFFSLSPGKRGVYLLPAFPLVALLLASAFERGAGRVPRKAWFVLPAAALALLGAALAVVSTLPDRPAALDDITGRLGSWWLVLPIGAGLLLLAGGIAAAVGAWRAPAGTVPPLVVASAAVLVLVGTAGGHARNVAQGGAAFGERVAAVVPEGERLAVERGKFELILYYARRRGTEFETLAGLAAARAKGDRYVVLRDTTYARLTGTPALAGLSELDRAPLGRAEFVLLGPTGSARR